MSNQLSSFAYGGIALTQTILINGIPHITKQAIGEWLEYADPRKAVNKILGRNPHIDTYSVGVNLGSTDGKNYETNVYHPIGFLLIVMESGQPKAKQKKVEVAEFVWHFSNKAPTLPEDVSPKEYRAILSRITNLTSKMARIKDAMEHKQTWLEITVLCDTIGLAYPAIEFMRKHFRQVEKLGINAPDMYAKPDDELKQLAHPDNFADDYIY